MKEFFKKLYEKYSSWIIAFLIVLIIGVIAYFNYRLREEQKKMDEVEYTDTTGTYNKLYYEKKFKELKNENRELYDSLKHYKDKIDYIVQFYHEKEYNTGQVHTKPNVIDSVVYDTIPVSVPQIAKTYEYLSEPNDTFQYKLNVNSFTEPNWYSIQAKVKNKFTIVNKEEGGMNHITIEPGNGGTITDPTVWKKKEKRGFWNRFSFGPGVTAGYDPINKRFGVVVGASATFDLK
ncbi:MAG: hypothetical protein J5965_29010 [Aeriscardovia sp.]|nr:hypothetical protein [Aeriscardovia sp.]